MGTAAADFAKKAGESDSPPHNTQGYFGGQSVKNGKGGNHIYSTKESKRLRQFQKLPQPSFCAKSCRSPVLAGPDTQTVSAGILAHASSALGKRLLGNIQ